MPRYRQDFYNLCRLVAQVKGKETKNFLDHHANSGDLKRYEDDQITIVIDLSSQAMTITRNENKNPVVYIATNGKCFRSHGEQSKLYSYVADLVKEIAQEFKNGELK